MEKMRLVEAEGESANTEEETGGVGAVLPSNHSEGPRLRMMEGRPDSGGQKRTWGQGEVFRQDANQYRTPRCSEPSLGVIDSEASCAAVAGADGAKVIKVRART